MAWQEVETDLGPAPGRVKYSVCMKRGGARVSVPKVVVDELGWSAATRFKLLIGAGDLEGKLRLEPKEGGAISGRIAPKGGGLLIRLGRWPALAPRDVDAIAVGSDVNDDALTIQLPEHARLVPPAARPAASIMGAAQSARDANGVKTAPTAKRDVTHRFFDDPKRPVAMASGTRGGK